MRRIVANPEILGGKPILEGTRLSVEHILGLLSHGMSHIEIVDSHPELSIADINTVVHNVIERPPIVAPRAGSVGYVTGCVSDLKIC